MPSNEWGEWPAYKFGLAMSDISSTLAQQYNTMPIQILVDEIFYADVYQAADKASTKQEFHALLQQRKNQRTKSITDAIRTICETLISADLPGQDLPTSVIKTFSNHPNMTLLAIILNSLGPADGPNVEVMGKQDIKTLQDHQTRRLRPNYQSPPMSPPHSFTNDAPPAFDFDYFGPAEVVTVTQPESLGDFDNANSFHEENTDEYWGDESQPAHFDDFPPADEDEDEDEEISQTCNLSLSTATKAQSKRDDDVSFSNSRDSVLTFRATIDPQPADERCDGYSQPPTLDDWIDKTSPHDSYQWWEPPGRANLSETDDSPVSIPDTASIGGDSCSVLVQDDGNMHVQDIDMESIASQPSFVNVDGSAENTSTSFEDNIFGIKKTELHDALVAVRGSPKDKTSPSSKTVHGKKNSSASPDSKPTRRISNTSFKNSSRIHKTVKS